MSSITFLTSFCKILNSCFFYFFSSKLFPYRIPKCPCLSQFCALTATFINYAWDKLYIIFVVSYIILSFKNATMVTLWCTSMNFPKFLQTYLFFGSYVLIQIWSNSKQYFCVMLFYHVRILHNTTVFYYVEKELDNYICFLKKHNSYTISTLYLYIWSI